MSGFFFLQCELESGETFTVVDSYSLELQKVLCDVCVSGVFSEGEFVSGLGEVFESFVVVFAGWIHEACYGLAYKVFHN